MRGTRLALGAVVTALTCAAGLTTGQLTANAATATDAYGSATSCKLGTSKVILQPHFATNGNKRRIDGYAFRTSPADTIIAVVEAASTGRTQTNPHASRGSRTNLGRHYAWRDSGLTLVGFRVRDAAGRSCGAPGIRI